MVKQDEMNYLGNSAFYRMLDIRINQGLTVEMEPGLCMEREGRRSDVGGRCSVIGDGS